jgi:transcriptional regulator with XRE-family HTH domain
MKKTINKTLIAGFRLEELSALTGIGFYTLGRILRGEREITKTEQLALLSVTGFRPEELFIVVKDDKRAS